MFIELIITVCADKNYCYEQFVRLRLKRVRVTVDTKKNIIQTIAETSRQVVETAKNVNTDSHVRKNITEKSLFVLQDILTRNDTLKQNFNRVFQYLSDSLDGISKNSDEFKTNVHYFFEIINKIKNARQLLDNLNNEINHLTVIVNEIKNDTDEIFTLALNASIVSSKYTHTSGVFDIIANKLNEMSNFINQNLESMVVVVQPITDGISNLYNENVKILVDIENGYNNFIEFSTVIDEQKSSIRELTEKASVSGSKIDDQRLMLEDISTKVWQMDEDADGAIRGSANVMDMGNELAGRIDGIDIDALTSDEFLSNIATINETGISIRQSAQNVNQKSRSQLEFSLSCVEFCDSIIVESGELRKVSESFNEQSVENNRIANAILQNLGRIASQLNNIEGKIGISNQTIGKFNQDYLQIDSILEFLKNILKSMNIIGMYSRIESARDPEEYAGFMTISENIIKLQSKIHNNIPLIEENISMTHGFIESVNQTFMNVATMFYSILSSSNTIIENLKKITQLSIESENFSMATLDETKELDTGLKGLRESLINLTHVVKKPIDGSAANIERGKLIESLCEELK